MVGRFRKNQVKMVPNEKKVRRSMHLFPHLDFPRNVYFEVNEDTGQVRYWRDEHAKGPGTLENPVIRYWQSRTREYLAMVRSFQRRHPSTTAAATAARQSQSKREKVAEAWHQERLDDRNAANRVARRVHVSVPYARKVRAEMRREMEAEK